MGTKKPQLRALGITCGIGSMMVGARAAGFKVLGNVEWRKYYHAKDDAGRNTFLTNFPGAFMVEKIDELGEKEAELRGVDLVMGHPECGNFSGLNANKSLRHDPGDIPLFTDLIERVEPRFFVMDDLPKSFIAFNMEEYAKRLPQYDLFPEWVSNHGYGNVQKQRKRFFMIGALKKEGFTFRPGEVRHQGTVKDIIGDILGKEGKLPNHEAHALDALCAKGYHLKYHGHRATWKEMRDYVLKEMREGAPIQYHGPDGNILTRVGSYKGHWEGPAHVLTGGISGFHPIKGVPYSVRERARLQGFPDDFIFYGTELDKKGRWNHDKNMHMVKQTGKAMPIQFNTYVARQIYAHITGKRFECSDARVLPNDVYIDQAKTWYCQNVKYGKHQEAACGACWLNSSCPMSLTLSAETRKEIEDGFKNQGNAPRQRVEKGRLPGEVRTDVKQRPPRATDPRRQLAREPKVVSYDEAFQKPVKSW